MARLETHSWDPWDAQSEQAGAGCEIQIVSVLMRPPPLHPYTTKQTSPQPSEVGRRSWCRVVLVWSWLCAVTGAESSQTGGYKKPVLTKACSIMNEKS